MSVPPRKRKQNGSGRRNVARRPHAGEKVSTHEPGIHRYVSPRGPDYDTFYPKIGNQWLPSCRAWRKPSGSGWTRWASPRTARG